MKKLFLIGAMAMLFACAKDEANVGCTTQPEGISLYGLKQLEGTGTRGVALKDRMWKTGETIRIKFLNGTETQKTKVQEFAAEWLQYANLTFDYVAANETADVKISFDWQGDKVTWSYVGTEARTAPQSQPSTNFGKLSTVDKMMKRDILMEFGHILGLVNEHQGPECPIQWDVETVYAYYLEAGWKSREVTDFFFRPYTAAEANYTVFDPKSIMVWPIDDILTLDGTAYPRNSELSATDKQFIAELYPRIQTEPTILTFEFNSSTYADFRTLKFSEMLLTSDTVVIDFGNGNRYEGPAPQAPSVTYDNGIYEVKVWAKEMNLKINGVPRINENGAIRLFPITKCFLSKNTEYTGIDFYRSKLREVSYSQIPNFGSITSFANAFAESELEVIPDDILCKATQATDFYRTFQGTQIKKIPEGLFDHNLLVTVFNQTFANNHALTSIPQGLFDKHTQITSFYGIFHECVSLMNIPSGLFDKNTLVTDFGLVFSACRSLESIPESLFDKNLLVKSFYASFLGSGIKKIPEKLFNIHMQVTSFKWAFSSCRNLTSIPERLFEKNILATDFNGVFTYCENLRSIPQGLFEKNTLAINFEGAFLMCTGLTEIPQSLFAKNIEAVSFKETFELCSSLTEIPKDLFANNPKATSFEATFWGCSNLKSVPQGLFVNKSVYSFDKIFSNCTNLTDVPVDLFDNQRDDSRFNWAFEKCTNLKFAIPLWERYPNSIYHYGCYIDCTSVSNWADIPAGWK